MTGEQPVSEDGTRRLADNAARSLPEQQPQLLEVGLWARRAGVPQSGGALLARSRATLPLPYRTRFGCSLLSGASPRLRLGYISATLSATTHRVVGGLSRAAAWVAEHAHPHGVAAMPRQESAHKPQELETTPKAAGIMLAEFAGRRRRSLAQSRHEQQVAGADSVAGGDHCSGVRPRDVAREVQLQS